MRLSNAARQKKHRLKKSKRIYKGVEGIDYVECKICGKRALSLNKKHFDMHSTTKEEYQLRFPDAYIISERKKKSQARPCNKSRTGYKNSTWHNKRISECQKGKSNSFYSKAHSKEVMKKAAEKRKRTSIKLMIYMMTYMK